MLRRAYHYGIPVFGEEANALFQATNPNRGKEMQDFQDALPTGLFQGKHVPELLQCAERPDAFVVHLDLLNLLMFLVSDPVVQNRLPAYLRSDGMRPIEDLRNTKKNKEIYFHYLRGTFPYAASLMVNTLYLPFNRNAKQWNERAALLRRTAPHVDTGLFKFLFDERLPRPDIHKSIHDAWFEAVEELKCDRAYVCKGAKGVLEIKELTPNSGVAREYPFLPVNQRAAQH